MDETWDELLGETQEELEASQEDELKLNDACDPTTLPVHDNGGNNPRPLPSFALAANTEAGMINGDAPALARGAGEGSSLDTYPAAEEELLHPEGLTLLDCVLEGVPRCLSQCLSKGKGNAFLDLECCWGARRDTTCPLTFEVACGWREVTLDQVEAIRPLPSCCSLFCSLSCL